MVIIYSIIYVLQTELSVRLTIHAENQGIRKKTISVFLYTGKGLHFVYFVYLIDYTHCNIWYSNFTWDGCIQFTACERTILHNRSKYQIFCFMLKLWMTWCAHSKTVTGKFIQSFEPPHDKTNNMVCVPSEDSDQPGHPPSLFRVFAAHMKKHWVLSCPLSA